MLERILLIQLLFARANKPDAGECFSREFVDATNLVPRFVRQPATVRVRNVVDKTDTARQEEHELFLDEFIFSPLIKNRWAVLAFL